MEKDSLTFLSSYLYIFCHLRLELPIPHLLIKEGFSETPEKPHLIQQYQHRLNTSTIIWELSVFFKKVFLMSFSPYYQTSKTKPQARPIDCSPPGSSVRELFQARILEWVVSSSSRGSSRPRDQIRVSCISCIGRQILYHCATWEAPIPVIKFVYKSQVLYIQFGFKPF